MTNTYFTNALYKMLIGLSLDKNLLRQGSISIWYSSWKHPKYFWSQAVTAEPKMH
jgi:hypothetical protein